MLGFLFQAEDGIRDLVRSRGLGDVYKRQEKWESLLNKVTTIDKNIAYGTPQLAKNIDELLKNDQTLKREKIFVTAGHEDGIFVFGETVEEAFGVLNLHLNL